MKEKKVSYQRTRQRGTKTELDVFLRGNLCVEGQDARKEKDLKDGPPRTCKHFKTEEIRSVFVVDCLDMPTSFFFLPPSSVYVH